MSNGALDCLHEGGNLYNKHCKATCNVGYELQAGSTEIRTCQADGTWCKNDKPTTCVAKECTAMASFKNGKMTCPDSPKGTNGHEGVGLVYQQACEFECNKGYEWADASIGSKDYTAKRIRECQADKEWSGKDLVCSKRTCSNIAAIDGSNGDMTSLDGGTMSCTTKEASGKHGFGANCDFTCGAGYTLVGSKKMTCDVQSDGKMGWTGTTPKCIGTGMTLGQSMYMKSKKWTTILGVSVSQCQRYADQYEPSPGTGGKDPVPTGCRCMNWKIKKPDWGLDSECCADPQQESRGKSWCYCDDPDYGGKGWAFCDENKAPQARSVDVTEDKSASNKFTIVGVTSDQTYLQYGKQVYLKTTSAPVKFVGENSASQNGAFKLQDTAMEGTKWLVAHPEKTQYYGYVSANAEVVLKSENGKFIKASDKKTTKVTTYEPQYKRECRDDGKTTVCVEQPNKNVWNDCLTTKIVPDPICPRENGFCVQSNGRDQNSGVRKINSVDGNQASAQANCFKKCQEYGGATGCEVIWGQGNRGCYIHTKAVAKGNGRDKHYCWIFSKCQNAGGRRLLYSNAVELKGDKPDEYMSAGRHLLGEELSDLSSASQSEVKVLPSEGNLAERDVRFEDPISFVQTDELAPKNYCNPFRCPRGCKNRRPCCNHFKAKCNPPAPKVTLNYNWRQPTTKKVCVGGHESVKQDCVNTEMCRGDAPGAASPNDGYYVPGKFIEYVAKEKEMSPCNRGDVRCASITSKPADGSEVFTIAP